MSGNRTFSMIKPDAVKDGHAGEILSQIEKAGFRIVSLKKTLLTRELAGKFYAEHEGKSFYETLVGIMSEGPIYAMILEKENAIADFRKLIGTTDPEKADAGTIRKQFAINMQRNAVHGCDSDENAIREGSFFFSELEKF